MGSIFVQMKGLLFFWCLFGVYCPTREFFTRTETSPLPVKGCKIWPLLSTHGQWAVRVLWCHTYCDTGHPFKMVISEDPWHSHLHVRWTCTSVTVTNCLYDLGLSQLGFKHPTFHLQGQRSNPLRQCSGQGLCHFPSGGINEMVKIRWPKILLPMPFPSSMGKGNSNLFI